MKAQPCFGNRPIDEMVALGAVTSSSFRLWMRAAQPVRLAVAWRPEDDPSLPWSRKTVSIAPDNRRDNTLGVTVGGDGDKPLSSLTRYHFRVADADDGRVVGEGTVETAPSATGDVPHRFAVAVMSCNLPFNADGSVNSEAEQMLKATRRSLRTHNTKFVLMIGDQMYADMPEALSLFNSDYFRRIHPGKRSILGCSSEEIRRHYQLRYRHFWNLPAWSRLLREFPCYMMWDDHDIVDNWGSGAKHREPAWQRLLEGARGAFMDYQASLVFENGPFPPDAFDFGIRYGNTAAFMLDIRSNRQVEPVAQIYTPRQVDRLKTFLGRNRDADVMLVVLTVPIIHLPKFLSRLASRLISDQEDFSDRWSSRGHVYDRDRLLKLLVDHQHRHPEQQMIMLSGDIHLGCAHRIDFDGTQLIQLISSGVTHASRPLVQLGSKLLLRANRRVESHDGKLHGDFRLLEADGPGENPYTGMNVGIIEISKKSASSKTRIRCYLYGHDGEDPVCAYRSPLL